MADSPVLVPEFILAIHSRHREAGINYADELSNEVIAKIGGEPWVMVDDDWTRAHPDQRLTILDDQGFMYVGKRRYSFQGPFVPSVETAIHDGHRPQHGASR